MSHLFVPVGIDSSDAHHDICIFPPGTEDDVCFRIANDLAGFQHLLDELERRWPGVECRFALENPRNLLARFLLLCGRRLYAPNPRAVARTREGLAPSGAKSDELDAAALALLLLGRGQQRLQPVVPNSPQGSLVAGLVAQRQQLVGEKTRLQNQLTATLKGFYPRLRELFADLDSSITRAALKAFPTPTALQRATREEWDAFFVGKRYPQPARIPALFEQAQAPQVPVDPVEELLGERQVRQFVRLLDVVLDELRQVEAAMAEAFDAHPDAPFFRSLPGAAEVLAPSLSAVLGDNRERWQSWRQISQHLGTAPITQSSGNQRRVKMRFHCDRDGRQVLHLYAQSSRRQCAWAEEFYQKQRQAGKTHSGALRSLANKWLRILFRMWQEGQPYEETRYLTALQQRQQPKPRDGATRAA